MGTPENAIHRLEGKFDTHIALANHLEIDSAHLHNFFSGKRRLSKTVVRALKKKGYLPSRVRHRLEITFESDEQRQAFIRYAKDLGRTPYGYCRMLGDIQLSSESIEEATKDWEILL